MRDYRGFLPHEFQGGGQGQPNVRLRVPIAPSSKAVKILDRARHTYAAWGTKDTHQPQQTSAAERLDADAKNALLDGAGMAWQKEQAFFERALASSKSLPSVLAEKERVKTPRLSAKAQEEEYVAGDFEKKPFGGSRNMPWAVARPRSAAAMLEKGVVDRTLGKRNATAFDDLVEVMVKATKMNPKVDMWDFKQLYNPHRHMFTKEETYEQIRQRVIRVLRRYPLVDIYDLLRCSPKYWTEISRDLGGFTHGLAVKCALEHVEAEYCPMDRAAFWTAVGSRPRQQVINQDRSMFFPGDSAPSTPKGRR